MYVVLGILCYEQTSLLKGIGDPETCFRIKYKYLTGKFPYRLKVNKECLEDNKQQNTAVAKKNRQSILNTCFVGGTLTSRSLFPTLHSNIARNIDLPSDKSLLGEIASRGYFEILVHFLEQEEHLSDRMLEEVWSNVLLNSYRIETDKRIKMVQYLCSRYSSYFPGDAIRASLSSISFEILDMLFKTFNDSLLALDPLHILLSFNRAQLVRDLLTMRPDLINSCDSSGKTLFSIKTKVNWLNGLAFDSSLLPRDALFTALSDKRYHDCVRLSEETGQFTFVHENGQNLLHIAALVENIKMIGFILENFGLLQSLVNHADYKGNTCLHYAVENQNSAFVSFLLENNANMRQKNIIGKSPLQLAMNDQAMYGLFVSFESFKMTRKRESDEMSEKSSPLKRQKTVE